MTEAERYLKKLEQVIEADDRYDLDAYLFVQEVLSFLARENKVRRHVSGEELLEGIRRYALREFGPLSREVFEHWGIYRCEDFGEIVFNMVERGILRKTEEDSRKDFEGGYDFRDAFG